MLCTFKLFITGVSIHDRGFGFVQFEKEEDAKKSVESENGSLLKGNRLGESLRSLNGHFYMDSYMPDSLQENFVAAKFYKYI